MYFFLESFNNEMEILCPLCEIPLRPLHATMWWFQAYGFKAVIPIEIL